jgi:hypothetical protein
MLAPLGVDGRDKPGHDGGDAFREKCMPRRASFARWLRMRRAPSSRAKRSDPEPWGGSWIASSLRSSQ